jgi:uncharacterized repeat protein (TIGR03803 family)
MRGVTSVRIAILVLCVSVVTACGGVSQGVVPAARAQADSPWIEANASSGDLLYVADQNDNEVRIYSYPGGQPVGKLTGFDGLAFMCTDTDGNVFIPNYGQHEILEYAHGGTTPIAKLQDSSATPYSCSFDSTTGNLAVANYVGPSSGGSIAIYRHAKGRPETDSGPGGKNVFCAYDDKGNLFIEAFGSGSESQPVVFAELPRGTRVFKRPALDDIPVYPSGLQWDGTSMAIGTGTLRGPSSGDTYIYRVRFSQGIGKTIGSTALVEGNTTTNFFIEGGRIVVTGGSPQTRVRFFSYPAGGSPTKTLTDSGPTGVVVSRPSKADNEAAMPRYKTIFEFNGSGGASPASKLVELGGKLFGTTMGGGAFSDGTVFSITPDGRETVIHSFGAAGDGKEPEAGLAVLRGVLYGTTFSGGSYGFGTVFSVTPAGRERVLHHFGKVPDGQNPTAGLTVSNGTLFGTSSGGGNGGGGTIFSITPGGRERVIYRFPYPGENELGYDPFAGLTALNGLLYGTTVVGGKCSGGTVFNTTAAGKVQLVYSLGCGSGHPNGPVANLLALGNVLYGTTTEGGAPAYNYGTVFSVTPAGKGQQLTYFPSPDDGESPQGALIAEHDLLYGTTSRGGDLGYGVVFSLTKSGDETVIHSFGGPPDGQKPLAGLTDVNGTLYGTTSTGGGFAEDGTVYKITLPQ